MRVGALIPLGFLGGAALCAMFLRHAPPDVRVDMAQPLVVVTYWQQFGAAMWLSLFAAIVVASVGYVAILRSHHDGFALRKIVLLSILGCIAALCFPVVFSSDVYAYAGYGAMLLHGIDPYAHARITLRDPLFDAVLWQWGNPPPMSVYGPLFALLAREIVAAFSTFGTAAVLLALRVLECAALVACAPLAYLAFPNRFRVVAAAGIALNPVAIWSSAEGHNDALLLAAVLAGFALARRASIFAGALVVALSPLLKAPGAAAALGFVLASWHDRGRFAKAVTGTALGTAIAAAIAFPLEYGVRAHLAPGGHYFPQFSLQSFIAGIAPLPVAMWLTAVVAAALAVTGARKLLRGELDGAIVLAFAGWIAVPNLYPWYALWILPVAFVAWNTPGAWAIVAATLLVSLRYYPEATSDVSNTLAALIAALEIFVPLALLSAHMGLQRRGRPESRSSGPDFATLRSP